MNLRPLLLAATICLALGGCMVGPDYQKTEMQLPMDFKEGLQWQRAVANPQGALASQWWLEYRDPLLNDLLKRRIDTEARQIELRKFRCEKVSFTRSGRRFGA